MFPKTTFLLCLGLLAGTLFAGRSSADPQESVRYVDIQRCLLEWQDLQTKSNAISDHYRGVSETLNKAYSDLKSRKAELEMLDPQSAEFNEKNFALKIEEETLRARTEWTQSNYSVDQATLLDRGVRRIQEVVSEIGDRNGFSAILMQPNPVQPLSEKFTAKDSLSEMNGRWVMWSNPAYDLTDEVLLHLNKSQ